MKISELLHVYMIYDDKREIVSVCDDISFFNASCLSKLNEYYKDKDKPIFINHITLEQILQDSPNNYRKRG